MHLSMQHRKNSHTFIFISFELLHYFMPDFGNPFAGLKEDRKLTHEELVRAIRFMISAEYEAIQLYQQLAESIDNKLAIEVLEDIANEEKVHVGEFLRLLHELDPKESGYYQEGAEEVENEIKKLRG
jgi:rubrerythrin